MKIKYRGTQLRASLYQKGLIPPDLYAPVGFVKASEAKRTGKAIHRRYAK